MNPFELQKQRVLTFSNTPANQLERIYQLLVGLKDFHVEKTSQPNSLLVRYSIRQYSLEALEKALIQEGFQFEDSLLGKFKKELIYYSEDVQYHNLKTPEPKTKKTPPEIFVKVYEHHLHGDHDDTPKELREVK